MDPLLEDTEQHGPRRRPGALAPRPPRRRSWLERWLFFEVPAYRLGLLLGYGFAVYVGISAIIAGVPAFAEAAPDGWTPIWGWAIIAAAPVALVGLARDSPTFRKIELGPAVVIAAAMSVYACTVLFLAYEVGDNLRVVSGAALAGFASHFVVRMLFLIVKVVIDVKTVPPRQEAG